MLVQWLNDRMKLAATLALQSVFGSILAVLRHGLWEETNIIIYLYYKPLKDNLSDRPRNASSQVIKHIGNMASGQIIKTT